MSPRCPLLYERDSVTVKDDKSVTLIASAGLCTGCGVCSSVCPVDAIAYDMLATGHIPIVSDACIRCGKCRMLCPGVGVRWGESAAPSLADAIAGEALLVCNAYVKNKERQMRSASGGIVTCIVDALLSSGAFDAAAIVGDMDMRGGMRMSLVEKAGAEQGAKSKYVQVSHDTTMRYLQENPEKSLVVVGVPCAIRALRSAMNALHMDPSRVLFLGLFCDSVMIDEVISYFTLLGDPDLSARALVAGFPSHWKEASRSLVSFDFKNKSVGGYTGGVRLWLPEGRGYKDYPKEYRMVVKPYFIAESCLYCLDKLNVEADIAFGDDYTLGGPFDIDGATSVIVRTEKGLVAWQSIADLVVQRESLLEDMMAAQGVEDRCRNEINARLKKERCALPFELNELPKAWNEASRDIGNAEAAHYDSLVAQMDVGRTFSDAPRCLLKKVGRGFFWRLRRRARRLLHAKRTN